jgi:hypothetical protein
VLVFVEATKHAFELSDDFLRAIHQIQLSREMCGIVVNYPIGVWYQTGSPETKECACNTVMSPPNT